MRNKNTSIKNTSGISVIEIVIALGLFSIISSAIVSLVLGSFSLLFQASSFAQAHNLAAEELEAVRSIKSRAYNELVFSTSSVEIADNVWKLSGADTHEQVGMFLRTIYFYPVFRGPAGNMADASTPGAYEDVFSKRAKAYVEWTSPNNQPISLSEETYLAFWESKIWQQSDWTGGSGQSEWSDIASYFSDDGNLETNSSTTVGVVLKEMATSTYAMSGSLISSAFDSGAQSFFCVIVWEEEMPGGCSTCQITFQLQTAPDSGGSPGTWSPTWSGPSGEEDGNEDDFYASSTGALIHFSHNTDQWVRYKAQLTGDGGNSPVLKAVKIYYE